MIFANALRPLKLENIFMRHAPIQSWKTTALTNWAGKRKDVFGIFTPVVNSKRVFMNANSKEQFPMEATIDETETLIVGKFVFSKTNFGKAIQIIRESIQKEGWLIIDEIGPLELSGEGFHDVLKEMLATRKHTILLVVRDKEEMVEKVKMKFAIQNAIIINQLSNPDT